MGGSKVDFLDGDDIASITSSYSSINGANLQRFSDSKQVNSDYFEIKYNNLFKKKYSKVFDFNKSGHITLVKIANITKIRIIYN